MMKSSKAAPQGVKRGRAGRVAGAVVSRLREPSTMAGLAALAAIAGVPDGLVSQGAQAVAAGLALAAVFLPEGGGGG